MTHTPSLSSLASHPYPQSTYPAKHTGKLLLKGGRVLNPRTGMDALMDVLVVEGRVQQIAPHISETVLDIATDTIVYLKPHHWVTPGLIDIHVHFREPGQTHKEDVASGSLAAAAGGFTSVVMMANTQPTLDTVKTIQALQARTSQVSHIRSFMAGAITEGLAGQKNTDFQALHQAGVVAFSDDGKGVPQADLMLAMLRYSKTHNVPVIAHAEDSCLSCGGCMNESPSASRLGLKGIPTLSESLMVARDIELARVTGGWLHVTHISSAETVAMIRKAKAEGIRVSADVTPHHLVWVDQSIEAHPYDTDFKMNPPLRSEADRQALIEGVLDGTIDCIATDHAPHGKDEKALPFAEAPFGVVGLETAVGVMLTHFFHNQRLKALDIIRLMSSFPASLLPTLPLGQLQEGMPSDITILDSEASWTVDPATFYSKGKNTPFKGITLKGKPFMTLIEGVCRFGEAHLSKLHPEAFLPCEASPHDLQTSNETDAVPTSLLHS
ncbi:MAG: dihydroorotase [Vampirovibrionales bacterium]